tara:strand:- start:9058 stop:9969 length:912 start_codon:yes stop_codon:yes gene_type:complete
MKKKVLVTGGNGFIGSEVCKLLLENNYSVISFDLEKNKLKGVKSNFNGSILDPIELAHAIKGCDYVIHLAASLGVANTEKNRLECLHINIQGTINLLEACVKQNIKKVIFASSSEIYGEQKIVPIKESAPLNPKSNYAITKLVGEEYMRAYFDTHKLKYNICRFFNIYGPKQKKQFVTSIFINNIKNNKDLTIYGNGKQIRSFCHVTDAAQGIVKSLKFKKSGEIFNIGNDEEPISILNLAKKIIKISNKKIKIKKINFSKSDRNEKREIYKRIPDITKAYKALNYRPQISLDQGLRDMLSKK